MTILLRKEPHGSLFIVKDIDEYKTMFCGDISGHGLKEVTIPEGYEDFEPVDFTDELTFSIEKYHERKQKEYITRRIREIQPRLEELSLDFIQATAGAVFPDISDRINEFQALHNELRSLLGKEPRVYK